MKVKVTGVGLYLPPKIETAEAEKKLAVSEVSKEIEKERDNLINELKNKDTEKKSEMRRELSEDVLPHYLSFMETLLEDNGKTGYFVNDSLTVADLAAWRLCGWISGGIIDGIPETILDAFPLLNAHQNHISNLPKVAEWLEKNRK